MKKNLLILLLVLYLTPMVKAQDMFYGAKVGMNVSHFMYDGANNSFFEEYSKMKVASHFGGFVEYFLDDYFALQPELLFSIKGSRFNYEYEVNDEEEDVSSRYVFKYITLPVLIKYYATKKFSVGAGVEASYLLEAKNIYDHPIVQTNYGDQSASVNLYDSYKHFDIGIVAGAGYVFDSGIYLDLRYVLGMMDTFDVEDLDDHLRNGVFQFSVGFSLNY